MRILGIDSGIQGGCALFCAGDPAPIVPTVPGGLFDVPTLGDGNRKEIHYQELRNLIWALRPDVAFIEQVNAFVPKTKNEETGEMEANPWGGTSLFRFGGAYFATRAVVACLDIPLRTVTAAEWKAGFGLKGGKARKDDSRQLVLQRYPTVAPFLKHKKNGHRAEAFLIAVYGARKMRREEENRGLDIPE